MAYVVVTLKGKEVGRWSLAGPLSIGRSNECEVIVRDILLSRRHCIIEPYRSGWVAVDLGSKNGTKAEGHCITRRGLKDGDVLTLGKTTIRFQLGRLAISHKPPPKRPADPFEALSGTVSDFDPSAIEAFQRRTNMPVPRPVPREPAAYQDDDLYSLLNEIASSSWDSIYAQASQPRRPIPRPGNGTINPAAATTLARTRSRLAFSEELQVAEHRPMRPARPKTPLSPLEVFEEALAGSPARVVLDAVAAPVGGRSRRSNRWLATLGQSIARPLVRLHRWIAPGNRVRLF